jgi:membrane-associated phospholipid phosphatase
VLSVGAFRATGRPLPAPSERFESFESGHTPYVTVETQPRLFPQPPVGAPSRQVQRGLDVPVLRSDQRGLAVRAADWCGGLHPTAVFVVVMLAGLAVLSGVSIALGLVVTHLLEPAWGIGAADERVNVWFAAHRTSSRTEASLVGSIIAGGVTLPILAASLAVVCAAFRKWRIAAFVVFSLAVESAAYRATTIAIHTHRPRVVRLESLPVNASYPSGHTAASVAIYAGFVLLLTSRFTNGIFRTLAWSAAFLLVAFVAASRMYRGMHHPLDVAGGLAVGVGALIVVVFACRAAGAAVESRTNSGPGSPGVGAYGEGAR